MAMKFKSLVYLTIVSSFTAIALPSFAQLANPTNPKPTAQPPTVTVPSIQSGFRCDTSGDVPTTMYQNRQGNREPWIKWVSDHFSDSGWSPAVRCEEVSSRLETYRRNKKLRYVTLGTVNNQSVICVASQDQGPCEGIIYTLKPGQDGIQALNNLFAWRKGEQGLQSNYESATAIPYIDVGERLDETKADEPTDLESNRAEPTIQKATPEKTTPNNHREL